MTEKTLINIYEYRIKALEREVDRLKTLLEQQKEDHFKEYRKLFLEMAEMQLRIKNE